MNSQDLPKSKQDKIPMQRESGSQVSLLTKKLFAIDNYWKKFPLH